MENNVAIYTAVTALFIFLLWLAWYLRDRYKWYKTVISQNPEIATLNPVLTKKTLANDPTLTDQTETGRVVAPRANFQQYLRYLQLACIPYLWSVPIKLTKEMFSRIFYSKLTDLQKRQRLAKMIVETSLILLFEKKPAENVYLFKCSNFRIPSRESGDGDYRFVHECVMTIVANDHEEPALTELSVNGEILTDVNAMFSFLNTLWCVYTHTLTHVQAGNVAEMNIKDVKHRHDISEDLKQSIEDMHSAVSGMNESANHYPADIWGIPRKHLQIILGYNGVQQITNHQNIVQCMKISRFVSFTMKARKVYSKHLSKTGLSISTLSSNTIFHSIDHYNMGKYMLHERQEKSFLGIDARMITTLLGELNYDFGRWQGMKYTKYATWRAIYLELREIDEYLADKVHMFVSV